MDACTLSKFFRSVTFGMTMVWLSSAVVGRAQSATQQGITAEDATAKSSSSHLREESLSTLVPVPTHLIRGAAAVVERASTADLPDAPLPAGYLGQVTDPSGPASVVGSVTDLNGNQVGGAKATLENVTSHTVRTVTADGTGAFKVEGLAPGVWTLTISAPGFVDWVATPVTTVHGTSTEVKNIVLHLQGISTSVDVKLTEHEVAEEQLKDEEKQRLLGILPNFYVSYVPNAAPLSAGQKLRLAARTTYDPVTFLGAGIRAGIQQGRDTYPSLGEGAEGYGERFGIAYGSRATSFFLGSAVFPVLFHQDPRYFYQGTGTVGSRAFHAISSPFYCKSDRGSYQPCYSNVLGNIAGAEVANSFVPSADRNGAQDVFTNALISTLGGAGRALLQEFVFPKITRGRRHVAIPQSPRH